MNSICKRLLLLIALYTASFALPSSAQDDALVVIVHPSVHTKGLSSDQLEAIFTMSERAWPDGHAVIPFNYVAGSGMRESFDRAVLGMTADDVAHFWIDRRIRGAGDAPRKVPSPGLMLRVVANLPGSIGYVPASMVNGDVRVVARVSGGKVVQAGER